MAHKTVLVAVHLVCFSRGIKERRPLSSNLKDSPSYSFFIISYRPHSIDISFAMFPRSISLWLTTFLLAIANTLRVEKSRDFPEGLEIENMALRPSGSILAITYASAPHLYEVPPIANSEPKLIYTFQNATGISSIAESSTPDEYFLITGNFSFKTWSPAPASYAIHRLSFDKYTDEPTVEELTSLSAISQPNGMIHVPNTPYVLIADCRGGFVFRFNTETLELTTYFDDPLLKPVGSPVEFGVNGIKLYRGYLYFSNTNQEIVARLPASGEEAILVGKPEIIVTQTATDDFIINNFNGDLYLAENGFNALGFFSKRINGTLPETLLGGPNCTALLSPSAVIWAKGAEGRTLIISNSGNPSQFETGNFTGGGRINFVYLDC